MEVDGRLSSRLRITLVSVPGPLIGALSGLTTAIMNPNDLPAEFEPRARTLADSGCDVLILASDLGTDHSIDLARHINRSFPEIVTILVAESTATTLAAAMGAGVRLVIDPSAAAPQIRTEVARIADEVDLRRTRLQQAIGPGAPGFVETTTPTSNGRVITVMATKGGTGKTTVAVNVAVELARHHPREVVLVDLDLMAGDLDLLLDLEPSATLASVAVEGTELDLAGVKLALATHSSGLLVLPAPETLIEADAIDPDLVKLLLDLLRQTFAFVVVDTGPGAGGVLVEAAEAADDLVVVASADLGGLRSLRRSLDALDTLDLAGARRHLVLNRSNVETGITIEAIEAAVEMPVVQTIPDAAEIPIAANQGLPYVVTDPRAAGVVALRSLAGGLDHARTAEEPPPTTSSPPARRAARNYDAR